MQGIGPSKIMTTAEAQAFYSSTQESPSVIPRLTLTGQIESLNEELANLFNAVERISERTSYICESAPPEAVANAQYASVEPPVIDALGSIIERIRLATARLHGLSDRVRI